MSRPLVSVCLPVLNAGPFLRMRMESLLAQTCGDWELIVCDSHSDDGSWEVLQSWAGDPRVRLHQVPREGLYAGWNECLRRITGRMFCFATSDDTADPRFLERMAAQLEAHPDVDIAMCQFDLIDAGGQLIEPRPEFPCDVYGAWLNRPHRRAGVLEFLVHLTRGTSWTTITSVLFRASLLTKVGFFESRGTAVADQLWAARTALASDTVWIPDHLATWRRHDRQASSQWSRRLAQLHAAQIEQTIADLAPLLPGAWKADPDWFAKLLWGARHYYRDRFGLDRDGWRTEPGRFLRNLAWSLAHEPGYALRRLATGLSWNDPLYRNSMDVLQDRIREWNVPWPPVAIP